jgi:hypothetical protein
MGRYRMAKSSRVMDPGYKRYELQATMINPTMITMTRGPMPAAIQDDIDRVGLPSVGEDTQIVRELINRFERPDTSLCAPAWAWICRVQDSALQPTNTPVPLFADNHSE